ncbi:hypothetical protein G8S55_11625 [Clostridium botulinum C]|uniref:hypothetical protein n=1 Tax=Clostridium botulinum TaxID=1491 RepID=UPI001E64F359|nr:hypothetical protein [Clostridium botulinum]MCD3217867.1 hypothetical protein [Clostridium botulinum C]
MIDKRICKQFILTECEDRSEDMLELAEIHTDIRDTLDELIKLGYVEKVLNIEDMDYSLIRTLKGEVYLTRIKLDKISASLE